MRKTLTTLAVAASLAGITFLPPVAATAAAPPAAASASALAAPPAVPSASTRIAVHFDIARGQLPENIALGRDGTAYVTFAAARQVAAVTPSGRTHVLATLPAPADGGVRTPVLGFALTTGIVRTGDGTIYFLYASGDAATTGVYRLRPGCAPRRIAALDPAGLPNGLALQDRTLFITDSVLGTISTVPLSGGRPRVWSAAPQLASAGFLGVNGIKLRDDAVWVSNLDRGTLLRISRRTGAVTTVASGMAGIDDFAFAGRDVIAALNGPSTVVRIAGSHVTTILTAADGLQNPSAVAVRGHRAYVLSAAYTTATDPNLILTTLEN